MKAQYEYAWYVGFQIETFTLTQCLYGTKRTNSQLHSFMTWFYYTLYNNLQKTTFSYKNSMYVFQVAQLRLQD